jgi:glucosamine 6-phosphate synthetase-like amidotransferase/phosphosugar isomerase protein
MRHYYSADAIHEAEAPLLASLPDAAHQVAVENGQIQARGYDVDKPHHVAKSVTVE